MSTTPPLPSSWAQAPIEAVAEINPRSFSPVPRADPLTVHFVPMTAVTEELGGIDVSRQRPLGEARKGYTSFTAGDVLFAKITPCMENGKVALVPMLPNHIGYGSTEFHVLRASDAVEPKWLAYFLSQKSFREFARQNMTGTAGQMRVPTNWLCTTQLPVAPRAEQTRIIEKLEELLSDLDAGVAELKAAQKKLALYRQSLLKAAVEGALTADWRAQRAARGEALESGADLLARILTERRTRWEARQLTKFKEQCRTPPKGWEARYPEPLSPNTTDLPVLPEGWVWASVDQLSQFVRNGISKTPNTVGVGFPILRINAVRPMSVRFTEIKHIELSEAEAVDYVIENGDLLATRYNGSVDLLGVVGLVKTVPGTILHPDKLIRMRPVVSGSLGAWIELAANTGASRSYIVSRVKTTAGQTGISGEDLKKMPIPLPSLHEQEIAASSVERDLSESIQRMAEIETSLKQATAQRKNLLKAAFSGQLVPQDPNDEPASALLARIRAEREVHNHGRPTRRTRKTTHA